MIRTVHFLFAAAFFLVSNAQKHIPCPETHSSCVVLPDTCWTDCKLGAAFSVKDGKLFVNAAADIAQEAGETGRYVAVGFSHNNLMFSTVVVMCVPGATPEVMLKKNPAPGPHNEPIDITLTSGTAPTGTVKKDGNRIDCSFEMSAKFEVGPAPGENGDAAALSFDLTTGDEGWNIFVVSGKWENNAPQAHGGNRVIGRIPPGSLPAKAVEPDPPPPDEKGSEMFKASASPRPRVTIVLSISTVILAVRVFA